MLTPRVELNLFGVSCTCGALRLDLAILGRVLAGSGSSRVHLVLFVQPRLGTLQRRRRYCAKGAAVMKKAVAKAYAEPAAYDDPSARYMGIATAVLFACLFTLNVFAY